MIFFFQAEDGIRDLVRSRGLGDVYKRQGPSCSPISGWPGTASQQPPAAAHCRARSRGRESACLLYTSDAADERSSVDLGGRRIIKKKTQANSRRKQRSSESITVTAPIVRDGRENYSGTNVTI